MVVNYNKNVILLWNAILYGNINIIISLVINFEIYYKRYMYTHIIKNVICTYNRYIKISEILCNFNI